MDEKEIHIAEPDVKASCREQVIQELERHFADWRERIVKLIYRKWVDKDPNRRSFYPSREEDLVQNGGTERDTWYNLSAYPSPDFFRMQILPTLLSLTDDPDELLEGGLDSTEIMENLYTGDLGYTSRRTSRALIESFFKNVDATRSQTESILGAGGRNAKGQFKYFYGLGGSGGERRHGRLTKEQRLQLHEARKWLTAGVALHQGQQCDLHCDHCDYTEPTDTVAKQFLPAYNAVPLEFRGKAMKTYIQYGGGEKGQEFLAALPECMEALRRAKKRRLLKYFFEIVESAPDRHIYTMDNRYRQFPIASPPDLTCELIALDKMKGYREHGLKLAKWLIANYDDYGITFLDHDPRRCFEDVNDYIKKFYFRKSIKTLEAKRYSREKICAVIDTIVDTPVLKKASVIVLENLVFIDSHFPGGFEALLPYLKRMEFGLDCVANLVKAIANGQLPKKNLEKYLELGIMLTEELGDGAQEYFHFPTITQYAGLIENDWEKFEACACEAADCAKKFPIKIRDAEENVFEHSLRLAADPNYSKWKHGLFLMGEEINKSMEGTNDSGGKPKIPKKLPYDLSYYLLRTYLSSIYDEASLDSSPTDYYAALPADSHYDDHARINAHFVKRDAYHSSEYEFYSAFCRKGLDYRIACHLAPSRVVTPPGQVVVWGFDPVEGVECPIEEEALRRALDVYNKAALAVRSALKSDSAQFPALAPTSVTKLNDFGKKIAELSSDPRIASLFQALEINGQIESAIKMIYLRGLICGPLSAKIGEADIDGDSFAAQTNNHTRMAIAGMSLLSAAGLVHIPGASVNPGFLNLKQLSDGRFDNHHLEMLCTAADSLRPEVTKNVSVIEKMILAERDRTPGLMPIGGKIHTQKERPMSQEMLDFIMSIFGLQNTPFKLIHAGSSLIIPPMSTALEFNMLVKTLELLGFVDSSLPDIQHAVAGRLGEYQTPYVGSAMLLGTPRAVKYAKGAFSTTHDKQTGARIMAYDAGVKIEGLPFDLERATGRTDMLGSHSLGNTYLYQTLGTMASHERFDGVFGGMMPHFENRFNNVLRRYGLYRHLFDSAWVYDHAKEGDSPEAHELMVRQFTDVRMAQGTKTVRDEVQALIAQSHRQMTELRERVIAEHPGEYEKLMRY